MSRVGVVIQVHHVGAVEGARNVLRAPQSFQTIQMGNDDRYWHELDVAAVPADCLHPREERTYRRDYAKAEFDPKRSLC